MTRESFLPEFTGFLETGLRFLISGHVKPDGDSVAACVTMARLLMRMEKEVYVVHDGDLERYTPYVQGVAWVGPEEAKVLAEKPFRLIQLDHCEPSRMGANAFLFEKAEDTLCLDHHVCPKSYAAHHYAEEGQSAASEVLYQLMVLAGYEVDAEMAKALYMGIAFDTGGFRHSSTTPATYRMAAELMEKGADCTAIMNELFHMHSFLETKIQAKAMQKAKLYQVKTDESDDDGIVLSYMEAKDFLKLGAGPNDAEGVVSMLAEIREAEVAVYLRETGDQVIRVNLRSRNYVDVAAVARQFGGGGHVRAAGCTISGPMLLARTEILKAVKAQMQQQELQQEQQQKLQHLQPDKEQA